MIAVSAGGTHVSETTNEKLLSRVTSHSTRGARPSSIVSPVRRQPRPILVKGISRPIEVKFASCESEWEQAFALAATSYQARGYETPGASRLRFTPYHALPDTVTLVAKHEGEVVATFSNVIDNTLLGLPMEDAYPTEIASLRQKGRRLYEATTLADTRLSAREFLQVFLTLIKLSMQYHTSQGGDSYAIAVNPRHRKFYTKIIGFAPLGPLRTYAAVQDHPAEAFYLDNQLQKINTPDTYQFMFGEPVPHDALIAPKMPRSLIRQFGRQSIHCNPEEIERILDFTDEYGSTRRW
jgi:hypothetical protein